MKILFVICMISLLLSGCGDIDQGYWDGSEGKDLPKNSDHNMAEYIKGYTRGLDHFNNKSDQYEILFSYLQMRYYYSTGQKDKLKDSLFWDKNTKSKGYFEYTTEDGETKVIQL